MELGRFQELENSNAMTRYILKKTSIFRINSPNINYLETHKIKHHLKKVKYVFDPYKYTNFSF